MDAPIESCAIAGIPEPEQKSLAARMQHAIADRMSIRTAKVRAVYRPDWRGAMGGGAVGSLLNKFAVKRGEEGSWQAGRQGGDKGSAEDGAKEFAEELRNPARSITTQNAAKRDYLDPAIDPSAGMLRASLEGGVVGMGRAWGCPVVRIP